MTNKNAYAQSGVDVEAGYEVVERIKKHVARTERAGVMGALGGFGGMFDLSKTGVKEPVLISGTDGVGTKLMLAIKYDKHDTIGQDCVAMCVNDIIAAGAEPLYFLDYVATGKNEPAKLEQVVAGVAEGCVQAGAALIGGETAEMPGMYSEEEYDLAGFAVGIADKTKIVSGKDVKKGDVLIGISSSGVHSNGFSFVRKIFLETLKWDLNDYKEELGMTLGEALLTPTKIYVKLVLDLLENKNIKAIAHITGGGVIENITRVIPEGLGLNIKTGSWEKPPIFEMIENLEMVDKRELHKSFNMGIGLVLVVNKEEASDIVDYINNNNLQNDIEIDKKYEELMKDKAYIIGEVVDNHEGVELW